MRARHGNELLRSIEPGGFVPQRSKVPEIPAGSATEIKDRIWRIALYRIEECRVILADIVVLRTVPEGAREPVVIREGRFAEATNLFRRVQPWGALHRPSIFPICAGACTRGQIRAEPELAAKIKTVDRRKDRDGSFALRLVKIDAFARYQAPGFSNRKFMENDP